MNLEQKKHLRSRLSNATREHMYGKREIREPAAVKRAHAIVRKFNNTAMRISNTHRKAVNKAEEKVKQVVLFGTADEALAAVTAFEKRKFKK